MNKILVICGPTASGKTALALKLAKKFAGDLLVADSRMVYARMDIVTGKDIPKNAKWQMANAKLGHWETKDGIRIWLMDMIDPKDDFSVSQWRKAALDVISKIWGEGKLPIVVGGTGLYIRSLTDSFETIDIPQDKKLRALYSNKNASELFEILSQLDSIHAGNMNISDKQNPRRLIRAIEVSLQKQKPKSISKLAASTVTQKKMQDMDLLKFGLTLQKEALFEKIRMRVDERVKSGALDEVKRLLMEGVDWGSQAMTAIGYRELKDYFLGKSPLDQVIENWTREEKKYAKRQIVWFKKEKGIIWFEANKPSLNMEVEKVVGNWYNEV